MRDYFELHEGQQKHGHGQRYYAVQNAFSLQKKMKFEANIVPLTHEAISVWYFLHPAEE